MVLAIVTIAVTTSNDNEGMKREGPLPTTKSKEDMSKMVTRTKEKDTMPPLPNIKDYKGTIRALDKTATTQIKKSKTQMMTLSPSGTL